MPGPLVPDELWQTIQPLLPRHKARSGKRGRPPVDDRACLTGIVFVLKTGLAWEDLPLEMGCGSGVTCWRRLRYWQRRGVWKKLLHALLDHLGREGLIDWDKACVDSQSVRAVFGGYSPAKIPRIGPKKAANAISLSMATAPHWPSASPQPIAPTEARRCPCSTTSRQSTVRVGGRVASRRHCTGTAPMAANTIRMG
jgi:transposase